MKIDHQAIGAGDRAVEFGGRVFTDGLRMFPAMYFKFAGVGNCSFSSAGVGPKIRVEKISCVGFAVGIGVGNGVGTIVVGLMVGFKVGRFVGFLVGLLVSIGGVGNGIEGGATGVSGSCVGASVIGPGSVGPGSVGSESVGLRVVGLRVVGLRVGASAPGPSVGTETSSGQSPSSKPQTWKVMTKSSPILKFFMVIPVVLMFPNAYESVFG